MAFFSRGKRNRDQPEGEVERPEDESQAPQGPAADGVGADGAEPIEDAGASVGISVSSFRGVGAAPPPSRPPARETAPAPTETMAGLRDNVLLGQALAALADGASPEQLLNVARQLLQGQLFLRVEGDARALLSEGKPIPLAIATIGEEQFVVAYSSGVALGASVRTDGKIDTSAMAQSSLTVIRYVLAGSYAGLLIDPASMPARALLRRDILEKIVEGIDPQLEIKTLLAGGRTAQTPAAVVQALTRAPFWVAVRRAEGDSRIGVAEARTPEGERFLEIFSHPLEVVALGRGDQPAPMNAEQLGKALRADAQLNGVIVDPAGPWIRLTRADLEPLIPD